MPPRGKSRFTPGPFMGQIAEDALMYLHVNRLTLQLFENWNQDPEVQNLPAHRIAFNYAGTRKYLTIFLTALTTAELDCVREFFNKAIDEARPHCEEMDRRAAEALERGDDVFARSYRALPQLVEREREQFRNRQSLRQRPEGVADVDGDELGSEDALSGHEPREFDEGVSKPSQGDVGTPDTEAESGLH